MDLLIAILLVLLGVCALAVLVIGFIYILRPFIERWEGRMNDHDPELK
jgi:hypothetical protein